jgi:cephalosporin hydroxylase
MTKGSAQERNWLAIRQGALLFALGFVVALLVVVILVSTSPSWFIGYRSDPVSTYLRWYRLHPEQTRDKTQWLGVPIQQCPLDLQVYQRILYQTRPDVLVETGTFHGGSAYFFASMFDLIGNGRVVTIDIASFPGRPHHPRITYLTGSSESPEIVEQVKELIRPNEKVMVLLDSAHQKDHVMKELELFAPLVTKGDYLLVHDTGGPVRLFPGPESGEAVDEFFKGGPVRFFPGPEAGEAVDEFLRHNSEFVRDRSCENYGVTLLPGGFLKRL